MIESNAVMTKTNSESRIHPKKFSLWLLIVGMVMLFAALTSAFIVKKAQGNWFEFELPPQFLWSAVIAIVSSATMIFAYRSAKKENIMMVQLGLGITFILGMAFAYSQLDGWYTLFERGIVFVPSPEALDQGYMSGTFVILLAGLHLLHALGGIVFLFVMFIKSLMYKTHMKSLLGINLCGTYWHFVGILWVYLYLFLYFSPQF